MAAKKLQDTIDLISGQCIGVRMRMLNRAVTNLYDDALRPLGVKVSQMNILVAAGKMGTARPADVSAHLHIDVSTLSRNVDRMIARGWLEVVPDEDGRAQPFRLTREGAKLVERALPAWKKAQTRAQALLGEGIVDRLSDATARLRSSDHS